jgi:hypothetical protein
MNLSSSLDIWTGLAAGVELAVASASLSLVFPEQPVKARTINVGNTEAVTNLRICQSFSSNPKMLHHFAANRLEPATGAASGIEPLRPYKLEVYITQQ